MNKFRICIASGLLFLHYGVLAQKNETAVKIVQRAVKLEDEGKMDSVLILLQKAETIDPNNPNIVYEIGYYYVKTENYDKALDAFKKVKSMPGGKTVRVYQMLGNSYDYKGDSLNAVNTYKEGLEKFPDAGELYLEIGNVLFVRKHYWDAIDYYEKGIEVDPQNSSNYYRNAQIWNSSTTPVWGVMYGELFMNLERNSKRTEQMGKWLADTYRDNIKIFTKDSARVTFHKWVVNVDNKKTRKDIKKGKLRMPFGAAYEQCLMVSIILMDTMSYSNMCTMRSNFIENWYKLGYNNEYPNLLFEYQHLLKEKGFLNAYNHWILGQNNYDEFSVWQNGNHDEWDNFVKWFVDNPLKVNAKNRFLRSDEE